MQGIIHTPTSNLSDSISFYEKLGFAVETDDNTTYVKGKGVVIEINPDRFARAGVKLFSEDWGSVINNLKVMDVGKDTANGYMLTDGTGTVIHLISGQLPESIVVDGPVTLLGNYAGISLEAVDFERTVTIWETIGFEIAAGSKEEPWVSLSNGTGMTITCMQPNNCPHLFFNPSLTYFNGENNPTIIENVRKAGIPITEEITHFNEEGIVDNIIIRDPGGFGFFLFND